MEKTFKDFFAMVQNQFQEKIKVLKTNNEKEYFSKNLGEYFFFKMELFTDQHVLTHHNKMELLKGKIDIYWK